MRPLGTVLRFHRISLLLGALLVMGNAAIVLGQTATIQKSTTDEKPGQSLVIASVPNLRDLGSFKTTSGATVAKGVVYRANHLSGIKPDDMRKLAALNLKVAYDLRTADEVKRHPDELPPGVDCVMLNVLADFPKAWVAKLQRLLTDMNEANAALGERRNPADSLP